jgi:hypothetical protein
LRGHKNLVFIGESGAPGGTILELFSAISSQVWNNLNSALVSALTLWPFCCLLGQLQLNSVVFFVSAWAMDSNEVGDIDFRDQLYQILPERTLAKRNQ